MKPTIICLCILLMAGFSFSYQEQAEETPEYGWKNGVVGGLNLMQTSFSNWQQGGENSFSFQLNLNAIFENDRENFNWKNTGKITYGNVKVGDQDMRKSIDEIKVESVFTYKMAKILNPFFAATGETQITKGYIYNDPEKVAISDFFDPAYFRQSVGINYKPNETIQTRLGPSLKQTITSDFPQPYADDTTTPDKIEKTRIEIGAESVTDLFLKISENILLTSKLELFSNFKAFNAIDVRWDTILTFELIKYVNVNFSILLFYDRDMSLKSQLKQSHALGLTLTLI